MKDRRVSGTLLIHLAQSITYLKINSLCSFAATVATVAVGTLSEGGWCFREKNKENETTTEKSLAVVRCWDRTTPFGEIVETFQNSEYKQAKQHADCGLPFNRCCSISAWRMENRKTTASWGTSPLYTYKIVALMSNYKLNGFLVKSEYTCVHSQKVLVIQPRVKGYTGVHKIAMYTWSFEALVSKRQVTTVVKIRNCSSLTTGQNVKNTQCTV